MLAYTTGTINEPDAGSVGLTMAEQIRDDVVTHPAWELVEEFTSPGTVTQWYVFRCLATESGLGADFYVVMGRTLANGELRFTIGEVYDDVGHNLTKYAPNGGNVGVYDADGSNPGIQPLADNQLGDNTDWAKYGGWSPAGTSTKWWLIISEDSIAVAFNGPANEFVWLGAYTWLAQLPNDLPLMLASSRNQTGAVTRNPAIPGQAVNAYSGSGLEAYTGGGSTPSGYLLGFAGDLRYDDALNGDLRIVAEQGIALDKKGWNEGSIARGWVLGKQKNMRVGSTGVPAGFAFGDAYAMNGTLWVPYRPDDTRIWDTGVAAS
jgi:hypothetical protein